MKFDLRVTRISIIIDIISHYAVVLLPSPEIVTATSQLQFVGATSLNSLASGVVPAMQSLALCITQSRSLANANSSNPKPDQDIGVGQLLGAMAVLQAIGQAILGPMLFGVIYSTTVAAYPKSIFVTAGTMCILSLSLVFMIRPDAGAKLRRKRLREEVEARRGRSRVSKDLRVHASGSEVEEDDDLVSGSASV